MSSPPQPLGVQHFDDINLYGDDKMYFPASLK